MGKGDPLCKLTVYLIDKEGEGRVDIEINRYDQQCE
jgi:hypothetical protein